MAADGPVDLRRTGQDGLAAKAAAGQRGKGGSGLLPRQDQADLRAQAAVRHQCGEDSQVLTLGLFGDRADEPDDAAFHAWL